MDEVTLYSQALSAVEIEDIFLLGSRGKCGEQDGDGDGFPPPDDCDDQDGTVFPGAPEIYDARDNDCDELVDEALDDDGDGIPNFYDACSGTPAGLGVGPDGCPLVCVVDADSDGFTVSVDCNDTNASIHPGAPEVCNGLDDDCDGRIDELDRCNDDDSVCEDDDGPDDDDDDGGSTARPERRELRLRRDERM